MMSVPAPCPDSPAPEEIEAIASLQDPVLRNLRITDCYYRLSTAFTARTGACANWCTFATWASRQAGCTIRGEDMLAHLGRLLETRGTPRWRPISALWRNLVRRGVFYPQSRIGSIVRRVHTPFDAFERASDAVARGNLKVFAEIGREFARFARASNPDDFLGSLRPGDPPEGQRLLHQAFTLYSEQASEHDETRRAQMILLANVLVGLHEQTRLQPEIREALEAGPATVVDLGARRFVWRLVDPLVRPFSRFARDLTCRAITESLMVLTLPGSLTLALGQNLDRTPSEPLNTLAMPELRALVDRLDAADCGASDWAVLDERMRYIFRLFRCFQTEAALLDAPFTTKQLSTIRSGTIPDGNL